MSTDPGTKKEKHVAMCNCCTVLVNDVQLYVSNQNKTKTKSHTYDTNEMDIF